MAAQAFQVQANGKFWNLPSRTSRDPGCFGGLEAEHTEKSGLRRQILAHIARSRSSIDAVSKASVPTSENLKESNFSRQFPANIRAWLMSWTSHSTRRIPLSVT